jgi:hypothetical protein
MNSIEKKRGSLPMVGNVKFDKIVRFESGVNNYIIDVGHLSSGICYV